MTMTCPFIHLQRVSELAINYDHKRGETITYITTNQEMKERAWTLPLPITGLPFLKGLLSLLRRAMGPGI